MRTLLLTALTLLITACRPAPDRPAGRSGQEQPTPAPASRRGVDSYAGVVDGAAPAVVTIRSARRVRPPRQFPFPGHPFWGELFGRAPSRPRVQLGLGSGVLVREGGYLLTNHHVVDGAEQITLETIDRRSFRAEIVGTDPPSDLAVLKADRRADVPVLQLGNSDHVRIGDVVLAIGNPLGLGQTVTAGIISAKGRSTGLSDGSFEDFLQTDAPINQGNSGGALINTAGELIGINSQILSPTGGNIGIGFAIPSNMARSVMDQLIRHGRVRRGQLGVSIAPLTAETAGEAGLKEAQGALVAEVMRGSPAERAGLRPGDVIIAVDGQQAEDANALRNRIASTPPGSTVELTLVRNGREQKLNVTLGESRA